MLLGGSNDTRPREAFAERRASIAPFVAHWIMLGERDSCAGDRTLTDNKIRYRRLFSARASFDHNHDRGDCAPRRRPSVRRFRWHQLPVAPMPVEHTVNRLCGLWGRVQQREQVCGAQDGGRGVVQFRMPAVDVPADFAKRFLGQPMGNGVSCLIDRLPHIGIRSACVVLHVRIARRRASPARGAGGHGGR